MTMYYVIHELDDWLARHHLDQEVEVILRFKDARKGRDAVMALKRGLEEHLSVEAPGQKLAYNEFTILGKRVKIEPKLTFPAWAEAGEIWDHPVLKEKGK